MLPYIEGHPIVPFLRGRMVCSNIPLSINFILYCQLAHTHGQAPSEKLIMSLVTGYWRLHDQGSVCITIRKQSMNMLTHNAKRERTYWCIAQPDVYTSQIAHAYMRN